MQRTMFDTGSSPDQASPRRSPPCRASSSIKAMAGTATIDGLCAKSSDPP